MTGNSFQQLRARGFPNLLPIIPHDATISSYSKALQGREDALGKIPGKRVSDGWVGLAGWESHQASDEDLAEWDRDGAGIGMRCTGVVAVDIDVTEPALVQLIRREAIMHLGFAPARTGNAPKVLLLFRTLDEDLPTKRVLSFLDYRGERQAIELLGARQQFVVEGVHPKTEKPYTWDEDLAELGHAGLPAVSLDDLEAFLGGCWEVLTVFDCEALQTSNTGGYEDRDPQSLKAPDLDVLAETVRAMPNGEGNGYQQLTTMAHAIHAAAYDDRERGLEILLEWSSRWPHDDDPDETARIYWSVHGSSIGAAWLYDEARHAGVDTASADFGPVAANDEAIAATQDDPRDGSWWSQYCYVNGIERFIDKRRGLWLNKSQFNDLHAAPDAKKKPAQIFLDHRRPYSFADLTDYRPGEPGGVYTDLITDRRLYNTWRPGPAHSGEWAQGPASDAAVAMWLTLLKHIIPDPKERAMFQDWLAHILQFPGIKPSWHPLLGSAVHGLGKDSLIAPIVQGLGPNARTIQTKDLESEWTFWAQDVQLVVVSELHSERRATMNKLKSVMAAPPDTIQINIKGIPQFEVRNTFGMIMFSNDGDAVAIERGDRRFAVIYSEGQPLDQSFYADYHAWLADGGAAAVCRYLMARDISGFDAKSRAPDTAAKQAMREAAMSQLESLLCIGIEDGNGPFGKDLVTLNEVQAWLQLQLRQMPSPHKLAAMLKLVGCHPLGRARIGAERERLYACRRAEMYAALSAPKVRNLLIEQREKDSGAEADFSESDSEKR